jgi:hypothetical protein
MKRLDLTRAGGLRAEAGPMVRKASETGGRGLVGRLLSPIVRPLDAGLRRWHHVFEFTGDPSCILRIALSAAREHQVLEGGVVIAPGDPIIDLHLWNEHLPPMGAAGPDVAWAAHFNRDLAHSLTLLAEHVGRERSLKPVKALRGRIRFFHGDQGKLARFAHLLGFELPVTQEARTDWLEELTSEVGTWAFERVFNPGARHSSARASLDVWMSRRRLMARYGPSANAARVFFGRAARTRS